MTVVGELQIPGHCTEAVRASARAIMADPEVTKDVQINDAEIPNFLKTLDIPLYERLSKTEAAAMPLKFDSIEQELNFLGLLFLLNFGSGWRLELHQAVDRGAFDTIRFGLMSMHISGQNMTSTFLRDIRGPDVAGFFDLPYIQEVAHPTLKGVTMSQPHPLRPFIDMLTSVMSETGRGLLERGYTGGIGAFILDITKPVDGAPRSASEIVKTLVTVIPGFRDMGRVRDRDVFIFKKAQLLVSELHRRFHVQDPSRFSFTEMDTLTIGADNVIPRVLIQLNILSVSRDISLLIDAQSDFGKAGEGFADPKEPGLDWILRGAAVEAGERIAAAAKVAKENGDLSLEIKISELETFLWMLGKEKDFRPSSRPVNKQTCYY
ncbi:hypothetical protein HDU67_003263 [Dinochytrium kinnereticum]|nr:hypothetical protein HDU67_003263 [Dinochytrium kinnereticum]